MEGKKRENKKMLMTKAEEGDERAKNKITKKVNEHFLIFILISPL